MDSFKIGKGAGKGVGTGVIYLNDEPIGRIVDGEYDFEPVIVRPGDIISFKPDPPKGNFFLQF
jgi:hypothetical protein